MLTILRRPEVTYAHIGSLSPSDLDLDEEMQEQVEIQIKYAGYIEKQLLHVDKLQKMEKEKNPEKYQL
ncbi:hypothetical protein HMSSN036_96270 [Paenibacillus macerans]|nr:hypothetical protein HMSSN036_96270 [Paenibacillus macerans]